MFLAALFLVTQIGTNLNVFHQMKRWTVSQNGMLIRNQMDRTPNVHTLTDDSQVYLFSKRNRAERLITRIQLIRDSGRGRSVGTEHKAAHVKGLE